MVSSPSGSPDRVQIQTTPIPLALPPAARRKLVLGLAAIVVSVLLSLARPLLVGRAIDAVRHGATFLALFGFCCLIAGFSAFQGVFSYLQRMVLVGMSRDVEYDLRNVYFRPWRRSLPRSSTSAPPAT